jgi:transcriptional regulator with XRE-family HTH domain
MGLVMTEETYGQRVARLRDAQGLTQDQFAAKVGIPKRTLQDLELGNVAKPQRRTREKIDAALGLATPEETREEWPLDVRVFLDMMGAWLSTMGEAERLRFIHDETRRIFEGE